MDDQLTAFVIRETFCDTVDRAGLDGIARRLLDGAEVGARWEHWRIRYRLPIADLPLPVIFGTPVGREGSPRFCERARHLCFHDFLVRIVPATQPCDLARFTQRPGDVNRYQPLLNLFRERTNCEAGL